jgi:glycosyltransferase involved in cell wall biosynthesis
MSVIDVSDINKEDFNQDKNEDQKDKEDKEKDKEKETSNLLDKFSRYAKEKKIEAYCLMEKDNEIYFFVVLACFVFIIYTLTKSKLNPNDRYNLNKSFIYIVETNETINNFENRYKHLYPTLNLTNQTPHISEVMDARILYIHESNITNDYLRHIRSIDYSEEEKFEQILYNQVSTNHKFDENRTNYINTSKFTDLCKKEILINASQISQKELYNLKEPTISIIIPVYNKKNVIMRTVRSIQNQSFKNIEIILVDDYSSDNIIDIYNKLLVEDPRIRIFIHMKNMGIFRSRLDGFLYSRGKYILNFNAGDLFYDNLVLEDLYNTIVRYNLDSLRFSFKTYRHVVDDIYSVSTHEYPSKKMIIKYGKFRENVRFFSYGSICNRLIRSSVILKGLDKVDSYVFNAYKNLWEDTMWNSMVNEATFGHTTINRLGYVYCTSTKIENNLKIGTQEERDHLIKEFINYWLFDYEILQKDDKKKRIIENLRQFNMPDNTYYGIPINLNYLNSNFTPYFHLLDSLLNDVFVENIDKSYVGELINNFTLKYMNKLYYVNESNTDTINALNDSNIVGNNTLNYSNILVNITSNKSNSMINNTLNSFNYTF